MPRRRAVRSAPPSPPPLWRRLLVPVLAVAGTAAAIAPAIWFARRPSAPPVTRFAFAHIGPNALASTDNRAIWRLRQTARASSTRRRPAPTCNFMSAHSDTLEPTSLMPSGTSRAPFTSPDGQWVGFVEHRSDHAEDSADHWWTAANAVSARWRQPRGSVDRDGQIIFATALTSTGLQRISINGGQPEVLTTPDRERGEGDHLWPQLLPGHQKLSSPSRQQPAASTGLRLQSSTCATRSARRRS